MTVRAVVEYDGTSFCGMQFQPAQRTVAGVLEHAFTALVGEPVKITSAGRTDAGVHATGQVISFKTNASFPFERLTIAANSILPADVALREAAVVDEGFSARFSARERCYVYLLLHDTVPQPLLARHTHRIYGALDLDAMREGATALLGEHDFVSFCGMLPESGPTIRTIRSLEVERAEHIVKIRVRADGFLHRMMRTIVGTLVEVGQGRREPHALHAILSARDRRAAGYTAPAAGLYLAGVRYDDFDSLREPAIGSLLLSSPR